MMLVISCLTTNDMVSLAPLMKALRKLISTCELYTIEYDIIYNANETGYMMYKPSPMTKIRIPIILFIWKVIKTGVANMLPSV